MTIVVYRDGVMASDSLITDNGTRSDYAKKLSTNKAGWIGGAAGDFMDCDVFHAWVAKGAKGKFNGAQDADFNALLVSPTGIVYFIDGTNRRAKLGGEFHAIGSGADHAIGALEMKATAEQAVAVAIKRNTNCDGEIQTIKHKGR